MHDWLTFEQATARFSVTDVAIRQLVARGTVRTKRADRVQYFKAGDLEEALAAATAHVMAGEWLNYSDLAQYHNVKRGWLDGLVRSNRVQYEMRTDGIYYRLADVITVLSEDPEQKWRPRRG